MDAFDILLQGLKGIPGIDEASTKEHPSLKRILKSSMQPSPTTIWKRWLSCCKESIHWRHNHHSRLWST